MAYSLQQVTSDGTLDYLALSFEYTDRSTIHVYYDAVENTTNWAWAGPTETAITFTPAVPDGVEVLVRRISPLASVQHIFGYRGDGSGNAAFTADSMDDNFQQTLEIAQEVTDVNDLTADYASTAKVASLEAAASALAASASATAADASEASALSYKNAAEVAKTAAELAETNAETAEVNAELAETNAEAALASALAAQAAAELAETNAETAASTATTKASEANASAIAADASADAALISEGSASTSASTATTQAGIATTQAGIATTKAAEAAASAASIDLASPAPIGNVTPNTGAFTTLIDSYGNVRDISKSGSAKTTSYTLLTTDIGQFIEVGSGGSVTIPDATFSAGDAISLFNNTSGNITVTCSITTAYIAGTDTDKATVTLATRGVATILFVSGTVCVINGNVT